MLSARFTMAANTILWNDRWTGANRDSRTLERLAQDVQTGYDGFMWIVRDWQYWNESVRSIEDYTDVFAYRFYSFNHSWARDNSWNQYTSKCYRAIQDGYVDYIDSLDSQLEDLYEPPLTDKWSSLEQFKQRYLRQDPLVDYREFKHHVRDISPIMDTGPYHEIAKTDPVVSGGLESLIESYRGPLMSKEEFLRSRNLIEGSTPEESG